MDSVTDAEHAPASVFLGPEFLRRKLYQLSPPEDYTLSQSLARVSSYYVADLRGQPPFSEARYGVARKVYGGLRAGPGLGGALPAGDGRRLPGGGGEGDRGRRPHGHVLRTGGARGAHCRRRQHVRLMR